MHIAFVYLRLFWSFCVALSFYLRLFGSFCVYLRSFGSICVYLGNFASICVYLGHFASICVYLGHSAKQIIQNKSKISPEKRLRMQLKVPTIMHLNCDAHKLIASAVRKKSV